MFNPNPLFYSDGYKPGHARMLAPGTIRLYGTWIPRTFKYAPKDIKKILSIGHQFSWMWLHDQFESYFFNQPISVAQNFGKDMSLYLGQPYNASHFEELHKLGYLPIRVQALTEGIETKNNIPHQTFINTVDGFAWLTLYLETPVSALSWKMPTSATLALQYKRNLVEWVMKTDPDNAWLIPYLCHDFSARGLDPFSMLASGLGHNSSFRGSDVLLTIPGARYFYGEPENEVCINSVNASEHSVSTTKIFTCGEKQMIIDWLKEFPTGILSVVCDTFSTWQFIEYLKDPEIKQLIMARDGKLVVRPDSGDPVDITCGLSISDYKKKFYGKIDENKSFSEFIPEIKGVIELLWDIFGGTINEQGYKVLDPHIGAIYGDSITLDRQIQIYERLAAKGFACTNIVLGIGSFTYQFNTRDTFGFAAKGAWFEVNQSIPRELQGQENKYWEKIGYNIYKDPITDRDVNGQSTKKSLKGFQFVYKDENGEYQVESEVTEEKAYSPENELKLIYDNGKFYNKTTLTQIRNIINENI